MHKTFLGFERRYPRPRIQCEDCKADLVLRWGDKNRPHFAHIGHGGGNGCAGGGEGVTHKLAKELLAEFLTNGGKVQCHFFCCVECAENHVYDIGVGNDEQVKIECSVSNGVADIAIIDQQGTPRFLIEVLNKHRTQHRDLPWVELDANLILQAWENDTQQNEPWKLSCVRQDCNKPKICTPVACMSMLQIADNMGYLLKYSPLDKTGRVPQCPAHVSIAAAIHGCFDYVWLTTPSKGYISPNWWMLFLKRHKCMKCKAPCNVKRMKPFCQTCYFDIKNNCVSACQRILSAEEKLKLRQKYGCILNHVPGGWKYGECCHVCRINWCMVNGDKAEKLLEKNFPTFAHFLNGNIMQSFVWWFGDKKSICTLCLENLMQMEESHRYELLMLCATNHLPHEDGAIREKALKSSWTYK